MAKAIGYRMVVRDPQGEIASRRDFPFSCDGKNSLKAHMRDRVEYYGHGSIARGFRCTEIVNDVQWYCVNINGRLFFASRMQLSKGDTDFEVEVVRKFLARLKETEDERIDRIAEETGRA